MFDSTANKLALRRPAVDVKRLEDGGLGQLWPFLAAKPPLIVNALNWHTGGGCCFGLDLALVTGGTLYVAEGGLGGLMEMLSEIPPSIYVDSALGLEAMVEPLETDEGLRRVMLKNLDLMVCVGPPLKPQLKQRLDEACLSEFGRRVNLASFWGPGESLGGGFWLSEDQEEEGNIGLPLPASQVKLMAAGERLEICLKGPNLAPACLRDGIFQNLELDEDGFLPTGFAGRLADPLRPFKGMVLDGPI